jgi:prevent-host-death family protein
MEKIVGASIVSRSFGRILKEVEVKGDKIVVERNGQAVAAVVPIAVYEQWKRRREAFFDKIQATSERAQLTPGQAEALVSEAIQEVR